MQRPDIHRVIAVVLDGLRPDAIEAFQLASVRRIATHGASALDARTVAPSLTWPAITSVLTGVVPDIHGIRHESFHVPRPTQPLSPLPEQLLRAGFPSSAFLNELPLMHRAFGLRLAERIGFNRTRFSGATALDVLAAARGTLRLQRRGLLYFHWFDADRAGHEHGWMSPQYGAAAQVLDAALGQLVSLTGLHSDPQTLLIAFADHGGGGLDPRHHEGEHPLNTTIPILLAGGLVQPRRLEQVHLLDLAPTIAWSLGVDIPATYSGRAIREAFANGDVTPADRTSRQINSAVPIASSWPLTTSPG